MSGYKEVTLGHEDVEWEDPVFGDLKHILHHEDLFTAWVADRGLESAVELTFRFHRIIANQFVERACTTHSESSWANRTIHLCSAAKRHRNRLLHAYAMEFGYPERDALVERLTVRYPRAEWGALVEVSE